MIRIFIIPFFFFLSCAGPGTKIFNILPQKSYSEYLEEYSSCTGKGTLLSKGALKGKLSFSFRSQRDSTFLEFNDPIGRKAILVWITPNSITARNLIENKHYSYDEVIEILPMLKVLEPNDVTQIIWGVEPDYKNKFKKFESSFKNNIVLDFHRQNLKNESQSLVGIDYYDKSLKNSMNIEIKVRNRNSEFFNIKKVWKLLNY